MFTVGANPWSSISACTCETDSVQKKPARITPSHFSSSGVSCFRVFSVFSIPKARGPRLARGEIASASPPECFAARACIDEHRRAHFFPCALGNCSAPGYHANTNTCAPPITKNPQRERAGHFSDLRPPCRQQALSNQFERLFDLIPLAKI